MQQKHNDKEAAAAAKTATQLLEVIRDLAAELHPRQELPRPITLDSSLDADLGFDSLGRVALLDRIEQIFKITLSEQVISTATSPRDLLREVYRAGSREKIVIPSAIEEVQLAETEATPLSADTLVDVLEWHVAAHPDRPHIRFYSDTDEGEVITYQELLRGATQVASGLLELGLNNKESVVIMLPTSRNYFFSFFGVLLAGGIPVSVYPPGHLKQIEEHLRRHAAITANSLASIMITMPEMKRFAKIMHAQVENLRHLVTMSDLAALTPTPPESFRRPALGPDDIAFLQYTSGSTGAPKGVILTHANLLANIRSMGSALKVNSNDIFVSWLPLYHDMGLIGAWLGSLHYACQLIIMSPLSFIARPARWLWAIHRYRGTLSAAPNFAYEQCLRRIDDKDLEGLDLSSWRCAFNGAEAVSPVTVTRFIDRFAKYGFRKEAMMPVYGLAESSVGLAFPPLSRGPVIDRIRRDNLMASGQATPAEGTEADVLQFVGCGGPLPRHQIRIVDSNDRELPDRQEGLLQFQGPSATSGYFRNPDKTSSLFHGEWLDSGDMGYIANGEVFITGRRKDIIIKAGRNIYPEELEEAIGDIEWVRKGNVAVFGSIDPDSGTERLVVLAETRKRDPQALSSLQTQVNSLVTDLVGTPADDVVLAPPNTVLKTSSGKIRRAASCKIYEQGAIGKPRRAVWLQVARFALSGVKPWLRRTWRMLKAAIFAGYSWSLFGVIGPILWLLVALLPVESWRWTCTRLTMRLLARLARLPLKVHGLNNLPPPDTPCVFASNHASYLDGYVLMATLPRQFSFIAKTELLDKFTVSVMLRRLGTEFVERFDKQKSIEDARRIIERGRSGRSLMFFAEGTFMRMPGLLPFRMGAFETAVKGNLPVVPIAIRGTRSILRAGSWFPRRGMINVFIGPPITPEKVEAETVEGDWAAARELHDLTRTWILRHCGEPDLEYERPPLLARSSPPPPS